MLSERIKKIFELSTDYESVIKLVVPGTVEYTPDPKLPRIIRHAKAVEAVLENMRLNHIPGARIGAIGGDKFVPRPNHLLDSEFEEIKNFPKDTPRAVLDAMEEEVFYIWPFTDGHLIPGYTTAINKGLKYVIDKVDERKKDASLKKEQLDLLDAMTIELNAILTAADRYSEFYKKLAEDASGEERRDLLKISEMLKKVPAYPAETFHEALQSVWFFQMCIQFDDVSNHTPGRFDQYMYPFYKKDIESGLMTEEEARELLYEFWLKFSPGYIKSREEGTRTEGQGFKKDNIPENGITWLTLKAISHVKHVDDGQTMTLCGYTPDGRDGTNAVSHLCIDALNEFRTFEPKPNIMLTDVTDPAIVRKGCEILASGQGMPGFAFYNTLEKAFDSYGGYFDKKDYWKISEVGCVENGIAEKCYIDPMNCFLNVPKVLLLSLYKGEVNGRKIGEAYSVPQTYEELENNFFKELKHIIHMYCTETNRANPFYADYFFRPLVSAMVEGCIEKATPIDQGGSVYWNKSVNCTGFATTVNSLAALKYAIYDKKLLSYEQLCDALLNNWKGSEELQFILKNKVAKYGNGCAEVDEIAKRLEEKYSEIVRGEKTYIGTSYRPGIYSFYEAINRMGRLTGATPDGRMDGERLSLNSAPAHGTIHEGLTAALSSITSFDHSLCDNACTVDVHLTSKPDPEVIEYIVRYLQKKEVLFLQLAAVSREELEKAEENPQDYKDLNVRVSGFSAQYISLDSQTRTEIRNRSMWN